ncbi:MAG: host attachment protein [Thiohalophilus sp.]|uniref:host attachment protein n=1 Tax=Thiohalophilus sp. TaxID=3028392 RepID=UPI0028701F19|nr:host attachment protein [Thiohalophilus sp.]MDR9437087.1 host attachment protein [Thiohalophilus sp.]
MNNTWVLVANASEARLFNLIKSDLERVKSFSHDESRMKGEDLASDRPGAYQSDVNREGHGSYAEPTNPKEHEKDRFARELADILNKARSENQFNELVIVASPHFHGLINQHLDDESSKKVSHHIEKDYTQVEDGDMLEILLPYLRPYLKE